MGLFICMFCYTSALMQGLGLDRAHLQGLKGLVEVEGWPAQHRLGDKHIPVGDMANDA